MEINHIDISNLNDALEYIYEKDLFSDLEQTIKSIQTIIDYTSDEYHSIYEYEPQTSPEFFIAEFEDHLHPLTSHQISIELSLRKLRNFQNFLIKIFPFFHNIENKNLDLDALLKPYDDGIDGDLSFPFREEQRLTFIELSKIISDKIRESSSYIKASFNKSLNIQTKKINEIQNDFIISKNKIIEVKESIENYMEKRNNELETLKNEIDNLLATRGQEYLIEGYLKQADIERNVATKLRYGAITFLILSSFFTIYTLFLLHNPNTEIQETITRLIASLIISIPGIYLIKESNHHKKDERHYRDLGLDLAAIPPYLRDFDDETKKELKKELSSRLFAKQRDIVSNTVPIDYQKLIETVLYQAVHSSKNSNK